MPHRLSEATMELRGTVMRGLVQSVDDTGAMQLVTVISHDGMVRSGIEVYQPFGLATHGIAAGSVVVLLAVGADPGDLIALPAVTPALRFGGLAEGEVVLHDNAGDRVALRNGGIVQVLAGTQITLQVGGVSLVMTSAGIAITGDVTVTGGITATGDVVASGISLDNHVHGGVQSGGSQTGGPTG